MNRVLIRQKLQNGDCRLIPADVLGNEVNGILRVKVVGQIKVSEVKASETVPAKQVFGTGPGQRSVLQQNFSQNRNCLSNLLNR